MLKTICLNMIVKNESKVIRRCLESLIDFIDYWVIVDTGSTDGTQKIIKECLRDVPGELYERPWIDFAHNRNEALDLAEGKGDYLLFIDADDKLVFSKNFTRPVLNMHSYLVNYHRQEGVTHRVLLIDNRLKWRWEGVVHEAIQSPMAKQVAIFQDAYIESSKEGFRSQDPDKIKKDIRLLEESLKTDPDNSRTVFHLGVFCEESGDYSSALKYFKRRADMGGWDQEIFYALFRVAGIQEILKDDPEVFIASYKKAYDFRPTRAEPLYWMALYYMKEKKYAVAYGLLKTALDIPISQDSIYVIYGVYEYGALLCFADCAFHLENYHETLEAYRRLLNNSKLPLDKRAVIEKNRPLVMLKASQSIRSGIDPAPLKRFIL